MKKFIPLLLAVFAVTLASCEKDPDMDKLDNNYLVYTNYDKKADFKTFETYYLPDSILVIGDKENAEYWKDENAQEILSAYVANMNSYNPQIEMFARFKMKSSFHKTKRII